jgi:peptidoglycan/LPS O-acetylase OafA/YrhL
MFFHFVRDDTRPGSRLESAFLWVASGGWVGVELFFVLSGFLITGILLDSKNEAGFLRRFYVRRSLRILPLYYLSIFLFFYAYPALAEALRWAHQDPRPERIWYWLYLGNWHTAFNPFSYKLTVHFWSLAIEEQFYLVWPVVVLKSSRKSLWRITAFGALFALCLRNLPWTQAMSREYQDFLYRLTPFRIDGLLLGALAAMIVRDPAIIAAARKWMTAVTVSATVVFALVVFVAGKPSHLSEPMTRFGYSALGTVCLCIVLAAALNSGRGGCYRMLRHPVLRHYGKYSYGMYIFHYPLSLVVPRLPVASAGLILSNLVAFITGLALTELVARASWSLFETPFMKARAQFERKGLPQLFDPAGEQTAEILIQPQTS